MIKKGFKDLTTWQKARDFAILMYGVTNNSSFQKDYGLREQIRRSAVSIPSNLAEGDERGTDKEAVRFFYIAKGSLAELRTQMEIASRIGYIDDVLYADLEHKAIEIGKMIGALIKSRSS
ncbi:MAG: four helix bundle protein [Smithellaceae bacterium]